MPWKLNDTIVPTSHGFKFEKSGEWYTSPRNWHQGWSDAEKRDAGLVWEDPPAKSDADKLSELRFRRQSFLASTDWYGLSDVTMTDAMKTYRQALRDITETYSSIDDEGFAWPTNPDD